MTDFENAPKGEVTINVEALLQPVPNMDELRRIKREQGYGNIPIDTSNPLFDEPVVALSELGIEGSSYYSRPNPATGDPVPGVDPNVYLRRSVAETLADINNALRQPEIIDFFGGRVQVYVQDSLRPVSLQQRLHDEVFPKIIRDQHPEYTEEQVMQRRSELIAKPSMDTSRPSPHATGGPLDLELRYVEDGNGHKAGDMVEVGHEDGDTSERVNPDYFETHEPENDRDRLAQRNRRAFYAIMTGAAFGKDTGFGNNPTEWWHWGRGDQLSALALGQDTAIYSLAEVPSTDDKISEGEVATSSLAQATAEARRQEATAKKQAVMEIANKWAANWANSQTYVALAVKRTELVNLGKGYLSNDLDTPENRQDLQDEITALEARKSKIARDGLACFETLYDIDPARVDLSDRASMQAFREAGSAFERLVGRDEYIAQAIDVIRDYIGILTAAAQNPESDSSDVRKALDDYGRESGVEWLSHGNEGFGLLKHVITYAHFARGHQGRIEAEAMVLSLEKDTWNDWHPFGYKGKATAAWLEKLPQILEQVELIAQELPAKIERFVERYAAGEKLSGMNDVEEQYDEHGRRKREI